MQTLYIRNDPPFTIERKDAGVVGTDYVYSR